MRDFTNNEGWKLLRGRRIEAVREMDAEETREFFWDRPGLVLSLDNGTQVVVQSDPEGNDRGALFIADTKGNGATLA